MSALATMPSGAPIVVRNRNPAGRIFSSPSVLAASACMHATRAKCPFRLRRPKQHSPTASQESCTFCNRAEHLIEQIDSALVELKPAFVRNEMGLMIFQIVHQHVHLFLQTRDLSIELGHSLIHPTDFSPVEILP